MRPGLVRSLLGLVVCGLAGALTYRSIATGATLQIAAVLLLVEGLLLGWGRGFIFGAIFNIAAYVLLHFPVAAPTEPFGNILLTLTVYLGVVPVLYVVLGALLAKGAGALAGALIFAPAYVTFVVAFPFPLWAGPVQGATLIFAGFAAAFGYLWGIGALSPGASAHEGPTYLAAVEAAEKPKARPVLAARQFVIKNLPGVVRFSKPLLQPMGIAVAVIGALTFGTFFIINNPIVRVSRNQTFQDAANASVVTGEKFITYVVFIAVILGGVVSLAIVLSLLVSYANGYVNKAKADKATPLDVKEAWYTRWANFGISWVQDILAGIRQDLSR
jgi:hypothetical protein